MALATAFLPYLERGLPRFVSTPPSGVEDSSLAARARAAENRFQTLVEQIPVVMFLVSLGRRSNEVYVSPHIEKLLGYTAQEWVEDPILWYQRLFPADRERWNTEFSRTVARAEPFSGDYRFLAKDGRVVWIHGEVTVVRDEFGRPSLLQGVGYDISDRKNAEAQQAHMAAIVESATDAIIAKNLDGVIVSWNPAASRMFGYSPDEIVGQNITILIPPDNLDEEERIISQIRKGESVDSFESVRRHKNGALIEVRLAISPIKDAHGIVIGASKIVADITGRKRAEQQILDSLREKEMLLNEIHHRVKNNLAVISSMFYMQSTYTQDEPTLRILQESQDRVRSMALVHESLYGSQNFSVVDFAAYAKTLSSQLVNTYSVTPGQIQLVTDLEPVQLGIDLAVPCGLILNELVSNSLKHAFGAGPGKIHIRLRRIEGNHCALAVTDNGVGLPVNINIETATSMGLRLIRALTRQIGGKFDLLPANPGTDARLTIFIDSHGN